MKNVWWIAELLVVVGAINWGLVGLFDFNLVDTILGSGSVLARIVYVLVGVSGVWAIKLLIGGGSGKSDQRAERPAMSTEPGM
ncbi:MAG: DUF378 domain-containing protein [Candidatus Paceibacterota bacterium]